MWTPWMQAKHSDIVDSKFVFNRSSNLARVTVDLTLWSRSAGEHIVHNPTGFEVDFSHGIH